MVSGGGADTKKSSRRRKPSNFNSYVYKVIKRVHPNLQMSKAAMATTNYFIEDLQLRLTQSSNEIANASKKGTLSSRHVQGGTMLTLPPNLAEHAVSSATKAVLKFNK